MTPNDIVGMAVLNGLDMIAITDHNSLSNVESVINASLGKELIVIPGVEVSTAEEVHVICLFGCLDAANSFEAELFPFYSTLPNRVKIFGNQILFDENDRVAGEVERMLIAPTSISFDNLYHLTQKHGGAFIPAHIDRDSFSVLTQLGFLPPHLSINTVEVSPDGEKNGFTGSNTSLLENNKVVYSSDAHQLWAISEREHFLMLPERTAAAVIDFLR